ncbi:MAG: hypothetical protein IT437_05950 [Phycisphaerales bacterium]|nr:hypothetical protein [Phycisphaerales bacterium]
MGQATTTGKTCVLCGQDCSGKPRVKDPQGKYMCKACHEQAGQKATTARQKGAAADARAAAVAGAVKDARKPPRTVSAFDTGDDAGVPLDGLAFASGETCPCGSCGLPIAPAVVVCPSCGFNKETGRAPRKVKVAAEGPGAAAIAGAAANVLIFANPLVWLVAACVAGAIGAGAWYLIVAQTGHAIRIVILGIGIMVGLTVKLASGRHSGVTSGSIAVGVTLIAIFVGYWFAYHELVGRFEKKFDIESTFVLSDDDLLVEYARVRAQTLESANQQMGWPEGVDSETAASQEDFPAGLWREAEAGWNKATPEWKARFRAEATDRLRGDYDEAKGNGYIRFVFTDARGRPDIKGLLMLGGALLAALFVGSGGALSGAMAAARMD